ncbi:solute carrier family 25 member 47-A isoform X2 [Ctenopharyngodon idella]|uniref:solute carrier family 25 member 47-A isoform X2 n=1 Tax=Ctenopharyngodon idella TaxID=7959 RepID=UPI00222FCAD1|nr:solute carrier family 25 member 47-A isoform X2 [Ctenopharyngodon idella]
MRDCYKRTSLRRSKTHTTFTGLCQCCIIQLFIRSNNNVIGRSKQLRRCISPTSLQDQLEVHGFFKGMALPVTTISMTSSVVFGTYRNCLQCFGQLRGIGAPISKLDIFLSGMAGGVAQISVMSPGDIVKVRLQCQTERKSSGFSHGKPKYSGPIHCLLTIAKEEGVLGLYRGALPLAFRDGPSFATYFLTYNTLCSQLTPAGQKEPEWAAVLLAGGVAGMAGWSVGTPMDVIKARLQMDGVREEKRYRGLVHCLTETVRNEGPGIFFKSLGINCLRAFPVNMVVFAVYEVSVRVLRSAPLDQLS